MPIIQKRKQALLTLTVYLVILTLIGCQAQFDEFGIVFTANLNGSQDIYRAGSGNFKVVEQLTFTPLEPEINLQTTRDGSSILFYVPRSDSEPAISENITPAATDPHTYILNLDKRNTTDISDPLRLGTTVTPQDWSIDEQSVLLSARTGEKGFTPVIFTADTSGTHPQVLDIPITDGALPFDILFSPEGDQILYTENSYFSGEFKKVFYTPFIFDMKSGSATRLGDGSSNCWDGQWSPVGRKVLVLCNLSIDSEKLIPQIRLYDVVANGSGTSVNQISVFPCGRGFAWSPTGKEFIAHCQYDDNQYAAFIYNLDGSVQERILDSDLLGRSSDSIKRFVWSPDGRRILYLAGPDENSLNIFIMNIDGTENHAITTQASNYSELSVYTELP